MDSQTGDYILRYSSTSLPETKYNSTALDFQNVYPSELVPVEVVDGMLKIFKLINEDSSDSHFLSGMRSEDEREYKKKVMALINFMTPNAKAYLTTFSMIGKALHHLSIGGLLPTLHPSRSDKVASFVLSECQVAGIDVAMLFGLILRKYKRGIPKLETFFYHLNDLLEEGNQTSKTLLHNWLFPILMFSSKAIKHYEAHEEAREMSFNLINLRSFYRGEEIGDEERGETIREKLPILKEDYFDIHVVDYDGVDEEELYMKHQYMAMHPTLLASLALISKTRKETCLMVSTASSGDNFCRGDILLPCPLAVRESLLFEESNPSSRMFKSLSSAEAIATTNLARRIVTLTKLPQLRSIDVFVIRVNQFNDESHAEQYNNFLLNACTYVQRVTKRNITLIIDN